MFALNFSRQTLRAGSLILLAAPWALVPLPGLATARPDIGIVEQLQGEVALERDGVAETLTVGRRIARHDRLTTAVGARVAVTFRDGSRLVLGERGAVTIEDWRPEQGRASGVLLLDLESGAARLTAARPLKAPDKRIELRTPVAVITVRGTDVWSGPVDSGTGIIVLAGAIEVRNDAGSVMVDRRHAGTIVRSRASPPEFARGFSPDQMRKALTMVEFPK